MPIMSNTKTLSLWYLVMMVRKKLEDLQKKLFWAENSTFGPKKGHFGQSGPRNDPPSGQTATYQKTEGIQSYLRIWGTYDPIESGPSDPKKWGLYGCSVKKCRFLGQKCSFSAQSQFFSDIVHNYCHHYDWTHKRQHFCVDPVARQASGRPSGPILPDFGRLWQFLTNAKKWHFLGFAPSSHHFF